MSGAKSAKTAGGASILIVIAVPLWEEFHVPGNLGWNIFLGLFLLSIATGAILLARYFLAHAGEIGEARFETVHREESGR